MSFEDRQDLLDHKYRRVTIHYSAPQLIDLIQKANKGCEQEGHKSDTIVILKNKSRLAVVNN